MIMAAAAGNCVFLCGAQAGNGFAGVEQFNR
jgi:hypothetical protein